MFSIKASLKYGWEKVKNNFWKVVGLALIAAIPSGISGMFNNFSKDFDSTLFSILFFLVALALNIASVIIGIGFMKILLRMHDGENPDTKEIFSANGVFWKYLGASILYTLIVVGGLILLIIPGIYWAIKYSFATLIVVDTKSGPVAAIKESGRLTQDIKWKLLGFGVVAGLVVLLGYIALFVGALVSIPVAMFAWIYVYRKLSKAKAVTTEVAPAPMVTPS